jgi:Protein of unknown function (DUF642)
MKTNTNRKRHSILRRSAVAALAVATIGLGGGVAHAGPAPISEFMNGSFEQPVVAQNSFQNFRSGTVFASCWGTSTAYPGGPPIRCWRVTKGSVDIVDAGFWAADSGRQSVDLNSNEGAGAVRQDVVLKPGAKYHLTFRAAMNPDVIGGQAPLTARVNLRDNSGRVLSTVQGFYSLSSSGHTRQNMGFTTKDVYFTATVGVTNASIELSGGDGFSYAWGGPVVDSVALYQS